LRSLGIIGRDSLKGGGESVSSGAGIPDRGEPVADGETLPVKDGFGLLLFGVDDSANCFLRAHRVLRIDAGIGMASTFLVYLSPASHSYGITVSGLGSG
jgi:hypothetical protein